MLLAIECIQYSSSHLNRYGIVRTLYSRLDFYCFYNGIVCYNKNLPCMGDVYMSVSARWRFARDYVLQKDTSLHTALGMAGNQRNVTNPPCQTERVLVGVDQYP